MTKTIEFITFHNQFYLCDKNAIMDTDDDFWEDKSEVERVAKNNGLLGVAITNDRFARLQITILAIQPSTLKIQSDPDHIVEAGLDLQSGTIQVKQCPTNEVVLSIAVDPGHYRIRISSYNLDLPDEDKYSVELWPSVDDTVTVLKQYR